MKLIKVLKEYFFLLLFVVAAILYGYFNILNDQEGLFISKWFLVPSLIVHYLLNAQRKNWIYLLALVLACSGDFFIDRADVKNEIIGIGLFISFNLLIVILISEQIGVIKGDKLLKAFVPLLIIIISSVYFLFDGYVGELQTMMILYFVIFALLFSFSLYYYICRKTKGSLFFLLATAIFLLNNVVKVFEIYRSADVPVKIGGISLYALTHYLFYKAIATYVETEAA